MADEPAAEKKYLNTLADYHVKDSKNILKTE
jgi:hypothetical protein